jgi:integrase
MPKTVKENTHQDFVNAKSKEKAYKLYDKGNLRMIIRPSGAKTWQMQYRYRGKTNIYTIGPFDPKNRAGHISLQNARNKRDEIKELLRQDIDPNQQKNMKRFDRPEDALTTFKAIALEWHSKNTWVEDHSKRVLASLKKDVFPHIGHLQVSEIKPVHIVQILTILEDRDALYSARIICQRCTTVFDYAIHKGLCESNPAMGRSKFLKAHQPQHFAFLKEVQMPEFLHKLDDYHGRDYVRIAMKLLVMTFVRSGELRKAKWEEIDWQNATWRIPAHKMKMKRDHVVPLSSQALLLLEELRQITGNSPYLFPSVRSHHRPISDVTLIKVLRILGYTSDDVVPHGFRHTASTILNEEGLNHDHIERQLAHVDKNKIRGTYNHAEYLDERSRMMQWYSDHLHRLKEQYREESRS